jgi:hypothetical protein
MTLDLEHLKELCEKATEGPWRYDHGNWAVEKWTPQRNDHRMDICSLSSLSTRKGKSICGNFEDGEFIAECRTAVPQLISELKAARERIGELEGALRTVHSMASLDAKIYQQERLKTALVHTLDNICIEVVEHVRIPELNTDSGGGDARHIDV